MTNVRFNYFELNNVDQPSNCPGYFWKIAFHEPGSKWMWNYSSSCSLARDWALMSIKLVQSKPAWTLRERSGLHLLVRKMQPFYTVPDLLQTHAKATKLQTWTLCIPSTFVVTFLISKRANALSNTCPYAQLHRSKKEPQNSFFYFIACLCLLVWFVSSPFCSGFCHKIA